jgi:hypothetical protein
MATKKKPLQIDEKQLTSVVSRLLNTPPLKREDVKVAKKKPAKLIPPQE